MGRFANVLPALRALRALRERVAANLILAGSPKQRALAAAVGIPEKSPSVSAQLAAPRLDSAVCKEVSSQLGNAPVASRGC